MPRRDAMPIGCVLGECALDCCLYRSVSTTPRGSGVCEQGGKTVKKILVVMALLLVPAVGLAAAAPTGLDKELFEVEVAMQTTIDNLGLNRVEAGRLAASVNGLIDGHREQSLRAQSSTSLTKPTVTNTMAAYTSTIDTKLEQLGVVGEVRTQLETLFERQLDLELRILSAR